MSFESAIKRSRTKTIQEARLDNTGETLTLSKRYSQSCEGQVDSQF